ncbi:hypothetical protein BGO17_00065 [Candidatus Saccharibacteria bacterium 49-20]|nr:MAG: hypothetical protein BGO17_00065 [Candidatus Saccharibacteria bacterium 49-20]
MASTQAKKPQSSLLKPLGNFFRRFHLIIFFVLVVGCMAAAVLLINRTLAESSSQDYNSTINAGSIDQATLERVQSLHPSSEPAATPALPAGRVNPFAE